MDDRITDVEGLVVAVVELVAVVVGAVVVLLVVVVLGVEVVVVSNRRRHAPMLVLSLLDMSVIVHVAVVNLGWDTFGQ